MVNDDSISICKNVYFPLILDGFGGFTLAEILKHAVRNG
jgi:hypothetical protein